MTFVCTEERHEKLDSVFGIVAVGLKIRVRGVIILILIFGGKPEGRKMNLKEETQEALLALKLSEVPADWIEPVWDGNFCSEAATLPYHVVEEAVILSEENWKSLVEAFRQWPRADEGELALPGKTP